MKKTSIIWFGAAISIAEIMTGSLLSPLGWKLGLLAIILGHTIGCSLMYLVGLIGCKSGKSTMESTSLSFGKGGSRFFALMNALQLIGWTGVMIFSGASAATLILSQVSYQVWALIITALIFLWLFAYFKELGILPTIIMALLFILSIVVSTTIFHDVSLTLLPQNTMNIWMGLELSIAMPLSWLPLIGDYTSEEQGVETIPMVSAVVYFFASSWMYIIGLGCGLRSGSTDFAVILKESSLPLSALIVIVLSTVTTTYLDVYSCGISAKTLGLNSRKSAIVCTVIGLVLALTLPSGGLEPFLYVISSIFVPMASIQITDFFIIHKNQSESIIHVPAMVIFLLGFLLYRYLLTIDFVLGVSLPVIVVTALLEVCSEKLQVYKKEKQYA